jgi:hypothetical protein
MKDISSVKGHECFMLRRQLDFHFRRDAKLDEILEPGDSREQVPQLMI